MTSKSSKWQRGRKIVSYLTEVFLATPKQQTPPGTRIAKENNDL
jgi:hypothetical protein